MGKLPYLPSEGQTRLSTVNNIWFIFSMYFQDAILFYNVRPQSPVFGWPGGLPLTPIYLIRLAQND